MLKTRLLHPGILEALAEAGHGSQVLIADGNYPLRTRSYERAHRVFLNLAPDLMRVTDVLGVINGAIPIEAAYVMIPTRATSRRSSRSSAAPAGPPSDPARPVRLLRRRPWARSRPRRRDG
jgi:L-fucose mutarotase/ribose pyranase (RbsD/FucU family)